MGENTGIAWTDATWNAWIGCTNVGPGCDHCYAEAMDHRFGGGHWGPGAPRKRTSVSNWNEPKRWNAKAMREGGECPRVFCGSLMDWADNEINPEWRDDLWVVVGVCTNLSWMMLTKRIGNAAKMMPAPEIWRRDFQHVGIMATVVNQQEADRDIPKLLALKESHGVAWVGLSCEPLLGPLDLRPWIGPSVDYLNYCDAVGGPQPNPYPRLDLVIVGGESGKGARGCEIHWIESIVEQCAGTTTAAFVKQLGDRATLHGKELGIDFGRKGGDLNQWPDKLRVQDLPPQLRRRVRSLEAA